MITLNIPAYRKWRKTFTVAPSVRKLKQLCASIDLKIQPAKRGDLLPGQWWRASSRGERITFELMMGCEISTKREVKEVAKHHIKRKS